MKKIKAMFELCDINYFCIKNFRDVSTLDFEFKPNGIVNSRT